MNMGTVEKIAFRFTRQETAALMKILSAWELPGTALTAERPEDATLDVLIDQGIVSLAGEKIFVDRTISLVLLSAAESRRFLKAESRQGMVVIYAADRLCVLLEMPARGLLTITPLENLPVARTPFLRALKRLGDELELYLSDEAAADCRKCDIETLEAFFAKRKER